jgi:hypothetical protein
VSEETALLRGLTWERLAAERRVRRLKRGKHFRGDVHTLQHEAAVAARRHGCAVRVVRDDFIKSAYVWIQFVDQELPLGEPCKRCGSRELLRTHQHFGRCPRCQAKIAFLPAVAAAEGAAAQVAAREQAAKMERKLRRLRRRRIEEFQNVRLVFDPEQSSDEREIYWGRGDYEGEPLLLRVTYPLKDGARQPHPDVPGDELHYVRWWQFAPFARAAELGVSDAD